MKTLELTDGQINLLIACINTRINTCNQAITLNSRSHLGKELNNPIRKEVSELETLLLTMLLIK